LVTMLLVAAALTAGDAAAQSFDQLKCYTVKERTRGFQATVDLSTMETRSNFALDPDCRIQGKVRRFCTPVVSTVVNTDAALVDVAGQELSSDYTCYKVRCSTQAHSEPNMRDQFGVHALRRFKTKEVCVPAS
jgi:hypothetical protein